MATKSLMSRTSLTSKHMIPKKNKVKHDTSTIKTYELMSKIAEFNRLQQKIKDLEGNLNEKENLDEEELVSNQDENESRIEQLEEEVEKEVDSDNVSQADSKTIISQLREELDEEKQARQKLQKEIEELKKM